MSKKGMLFKNAPETGGSIRLEDLVLQVSSEVKSDWNETKYYDFVHRLCGDREYQKSPIFTALRYMLGGKYKNLQELAAENFRQNEKLQEHYKTLGELESRLQFPNALACSLDLATGTGKSYVLYAIAAIMLAERAVDKVLVLCPSVTIEKGLDEKFRDLSRNQSLLHAMQEAEMYPPEVMNADGTVVTRSICIENYHAILKHVKSSISDSFAGKGSRTLVLNDEAHHVVSFNNLNNKKWKEFLTDPKYGFSHIIGVSGTCYVDNRQNDYFPDVLSRYSLNQAIEDKFIKKVQYTKEVSQELTEDERWQLIHKNHEKNRNKLVGQEIRPISIVVTAKISQCEHVASALKRFLQKHEGLSSEKADAAVLTVTSSDKHRKNLAELRNVDSKESPVEWIVSVSMLTEGWDVKNVFQIIPHEKRAFNSKLLISQVLGRGLRIPEKLDYQPTVEVSNHQAWSHGIETLVNEILEFERGVQSIVNEESLYNFTLHNLRYSNAHGVKDYTAPGKHDLFQKGSVKVPRIYRKKSVRTLKVTVGGGVTLDSVEVYRNVCSAEDLAWKMWKILACIDGEMAKRLHFMKTDYSKRYQPPFLTKFIIEHIDPLGISHDEIAEEVQDAFLKTINLAMRPRAQQITCEPRSSGTESLSTTQLRMINCSESDLKSGGRKNKYVLYATDDVEKLHKENNELLSLIIGPENPYSSSTKEVGELKSPVNFVVVDSRPEMEFALQLCQKHNSEKVEAWIKNTDSGFYEIEYMWMAGANTPARKKYNPDFFIKMKDGNVLVAEIKDDGEINHPDLQNVKKFEFAHEHFTELNEHLKRKKRKERYQYFMLSPKSYDDFFRSLRKGTLDKFISCLDKVMKDHVRIENSDSEAHSTSET